MNIQTVLIESLVFDPSNANKHNPKNIEAIKYSLAKFKQQKPIVVDADNIVIAGNGTLEAARALGWQEITINRTHLKGAEAVAYAIADNRTAELADWDKEALGSHLQGLQEDGWELEDLGFELDDLEELDVELPEMPDNDADDNIPDIAQNIHNVKLGQIYQLGEHRLMCGDSTCRETVDKLMNGQKADITFTSPPYNVGKTPNGNEQKYLNDSDNRDTASFVFFLDSFTNNCLSVSDYVFSNIQSLAGNKRALIEHMYNMRDKFADTIIWDKGSAEPAMAHRVLNSQFEYVNIFSHEAKRTIGKKDFRGTISNIFTLNSRAGKEYAKIHKATFRLELPMLFIEQFTEHSCLDPFLGTGTTLIACEKLKRKCYGMELDPHYCSVIIERWQQYTDKTAVLL